MIRSAWCKARLDYLTLQGRENCRRSAIDIARKKAAFVRSALDHGDDMAACAAVGWRPSTYLQHCRFDPALAAAAAVACEFRTADHSDVASYLEDLDELAAAAERMIEDTARQLEEWAAKRRQRREAYLAECQRWREERGAAVARRGRLRVPRETVVTVAEPDPPRWIDPPARWAAHDAELKRQRQERSAEFARRRAEIEAQREARQGIHDQSSGAPASVASPPPTTPRPPDVALPCGCSAADHCLAGAALALQARVLTAREIAGTYHARGYDHALHLAGRAARRAYYEHRGALEHPVILAAIVANDRWTERRAA